MNGGRTCKIRITVLCLHCQHNSGFGGPLPGGTMPRHPDPDLEERILHAADVLWRRGGEKSLTMRAVARAAKTNTPAVYRRFKDRKALVRGLLLRIALRIRAHFAAGKTLEDMAEAYVEY